MYCCPGRGWPGPQRTSWRINDGDVDGRDSGKRQEELEEPGRDCEGEDETHSAFLPHSLKCVAVLFKALENSDNYLGAVFLGTGKEQAASGTKESESWMEVSLLSLPLLAKGQANASIRAGVRLSACQ